MNNWDLTKRRKNSKKKSFYHTRAIYPIPKRRSKRISDEITNGKFCFKLVLQPVPHPQVNLTEIVWKS